MDGSSTVPPAEKRTCACTWKIGTQDLCEMAALAWMQDIQMATHRAQILWSGIHIFSSA